MRAKLIIRLNTTAPDTVEWVRVEELSRQTPVAQQGGLQEIAALTSGCQIVVLVPGAEVLLATANVPAGSRQRVLNAIAYALEDQLATDVESLHFALGERLNNNRIRTAAVDRARMDSWLEQLRQAGIAPDIITSDILALPWSPATWVILIDGSQALVRTGKQSGWIADIDNLDALLRLALNEAGEEKPEQVRVIHCTPGPPIAELLLDTGIIINVEQSEESALAILGRGYNEKSVINLLQGAYDRREQLGKLWKPWRPALAMLVVLLLIRGGMTVADYVRLKDEHEEITEQIAQTYLKTFPDARNVVNPRVQMEQRLKDLRGGSDIKSDFITLLASIGQSLKESPGLEIQRINYNEGNIDLALLIGDLQNLDQLKQRLTTQARVTVNIESATSRDNKVEARLQIKSQSL